MLLSFLCFKNTNFQVKWNFQHHNTCKTQISVTNHYKIFCAAWISVRKQRIEAEVNRRTYNIYNSNQLNSTYMYWWVRVDWYLFSLWTVILFCFRNELWYCSFFFDYSIHTMVVLHHWCFFFFYFNLKKN